MMIQGACHCGNITFELTWPEAAAVTPRACQCSFCQKHGALWTAHPEASLTVTIADASQVHRYRFGTGTAEFHVCKACGTVPVCTSLIDGHLYAVVNTRVFEGATVLAAPVMVDFDGEEEGARLARRTRGWIGRVEVRGA